MTRPSRPITAVFQTVICEDLGGTVRIGCEDRPDTSSHWDYEQRQRTTRNPLISQIKGCQSLIASVRADAERLLEVVNIREHVGWAALLIGAAYLSCDGGACRLSRKRAKALSWRLRA